MTMVNDRACASTVASSRTHQQMKWHAWPLYKCIKLGTVGNNHSTCKLMAGQFSKAALRTPVAPSLPTSATAILQATGPGLGAGTYLRDLLSDPAAQRLLQRPLVARSELPHRRRECGWPNSCRAPRVQPGGSHNGIPLPPLRGRPVRCRTRPTSASHPSSLAPCPTPRILS